MKPEPRPERVVPPAPAMPADFWGVVTFRYTKGVATLVEITRTIPLPPPET